MRVLSISSGPKKLTNKEHITVLFLEVLFSCACHSEFLILTHSIRRMILSEKKFITNNVIFWNIQ